MTWVETGFGAYFTVEILKHLLRKISSPFPLLGTWTLLLLAAGGMAWLVTPHLSLTALARTALAGSAVATLIHEAHRGAQAWGDAQRTEVLTRARRRG